MKIISNGSTIYNKNICYIEVYGTYILFKHSKLNEIQLIVRFNE